MRQTFDESTDRSFGPRHVPLIRAAMAAQGLDGFLVPHEDEHQNEYLPAANDRLAWATGFTGSAGAAVILTSKAAMFVDGRYTLQVKDQVDGELFEVRDLVEGGVPAYLEDALTAGQTVGYDPRLHSPEALDRLRAAAAKVGAALKPVNDNPLDQAWGAERPAQPQAAVVPHPLEYSGEASSAKRTRVGADLAAAGADATVLTAPSSIAWLFNVRGGDVIRSPLPIGQAILSADGKARLFLDPAKVSADLPTWQPGIARRPRRRPGRPQGSEGDGRSGPVLGLVFRGLADRRRRGDPRRRSLRPATRLQERRRDRRLAPRPRP
jgi:Xaa-Pro aminopeptidase